MEFRILGPLEVLENGQQVEVAGAKQRALLAILLLHANQVVSQDRLIEALWEEEPPGTAQKALQVYVSGLRKVLGRDRLETKAPGYRLRVMEGELDVERFERLAETDARGALALWRGEPLSEFAYQRFARAEIAHLEELRLACLERRVEEDLEQGRHAALVSELERLVREHPLRERLRTQLMLALYRSGRQAEALDAFQDARQALTEELGIEPSQELRELQQAILRQDPALALAQEPGEPLEPAQISEAVPASAPAADVQPREMRKTVTVLSCYLAPTTPGLDPESLRRMTARAFDELVPVLVRHGATVERSLGRAVTALFGVPVVHEDDPLRAARAAVEMRERLVAMTAELQAHWGASLELRAGIATGEVVTGGAGERSFATGEPVDSALRLHQLAQPGETLLDQRAYRVLRDSVRAESSDGTITLVSIEPISATARSRFDSPMVGRERERSRLHDAFAQAVDDRSCQLFTILGPPGVGKSRLVREFVHDVAGEALVAHGRCLPYGEGITYWPVLEAVRNAAELDDSATAEQSLAKIAAVLGRDDDADLVSRRLGEVVGLSDHVSGTEEIFWAVRTFFEALARRRSLVLVFDDIHWGETTFLDLVDHISDWARDAPMLLICVARPELLDIRSRWGGGKLNATAILLEPLSDLESLELVENLTGSLELEDRARREIVEAADGNPLFVEEMLAYMAEEGSVAVEIPPTIQGLVAARLDRLEEGERTAIEAAAVEGKVFHESSVAELLARPPDEVRADLLTLVRKELIRPDRPVFSREQAYRFRHLLIRDAAYESIPKEARAALHERHAAWLEERAGERSLEFEEILGYHLEQAFRYRADLGPIDATARDLATIAGRRLGAAGRRALARGDASAAVKLVSRAASLLPSDDPLRIHVVPGVRTVQGMAEELSWAEGVLEDALAAGDDSGRLHARVQQALLRLFTQETADVEELVAIAEQSIRAFEDLGDELGQARAWRLLQQAHYLGRQSAASADAAEQGIVHARRANDPVEEGEILAWLGITFFMGSTPAPEAERRVHAHLEQLRGSRTAEALLLACLGPMMAMEGKFDEARETLERARSIIEDLGYFSQQLAAVPIYTVLTEVVIGDTLAAERMCREALEPLAAVRDTSNYCAIAAVLARVLYDEGRVAECEDMTHVSERTAHLNDVFANITWRAVRAKALARRGELGEAEALARDAIAFAAESDFLNAHADALLDLAEILQIAERPTEAVPEVEEAIRLYEQKGNVVSAERAKALLERLEAPAPN